MRAALERNMENALLNFLVWGSIMLQLNLQWEHSVSLLCDDSTTYGVYVIWNVYLFGAYVEYVGRGIIADRLSEHGSEWAYISDYSNNHYMTPFDATYAEVERRYAVGIEKFISEKLRPIRGERYPDVAMISVNLPNVPRLYSDFIPGGIPPFAL